MSSYTLALPAGAHLPDVATAGVINEGRRGVAPVVVARYVARNRVAAAAGELLPDDLFGVLIPVPVKEKAAPKINRSAQPVVPQTCVCQVCGQSFTYDRLGGGGHLRQYCEP